jgi:hypothetical protein
MSVQASPGRPYRIRRPRLSCPPSSYPLEKCEGPFGDPPYFPDVRTDG